MTISPLYTIHKYREDTFKVVCFKRNLDSDGLALRVRDPDEFQHNETKLDNNLSRARSMVLQYALCNLWEWFFTGTLDKRKYDRFNLDKYIPEYIPPAAVDPLADFDPGTVEPPREVWEQLGLWA